MLLKFCAHDQLFLMLHYVLKCIAKPAKHNLFGANNTICQIMLFKQKRFKTSSLVMRSLSVMNFDLVLES